MAIIAGKYDCPVCGEDKRFATLAEKKSHIRTQHGRKPKP